MNKDKKKIFFLARSLESGGTERQLVTLAKGLDKNRLEVTVCLFYDQGELRKDLAGDKGVRLVSLDKKNRWDVAGFLARLALFLRKEKPHVIYAMLPVPNIISLVCAKAGSGAKIVWGVRASRREIPKGDPLPRIAYFLEARLSRCCDLIIANSHAGKADILKRGFPQSKIAVIENGIDTDKFVFTKSGRQDLRKKWGVSPDELVIGMVANIRPVKDHETFLKAGAKLLKKRGNVRFVCVGGGDASALKELAEELGMKNSVVWTGPLSDMPAAYSALDVLCSASQAEGFSNVIAEAMSCGTPCVATDAGDSANIVGEFGEVVPVGAQEKMAEAFLALAKRLENDDQLCNKVRNRILKSYGIPVLASRTEQAVLSLPGLDSSD